MKKLHNIQIELKAPKGQHNKFGNFNYRSCEDILQAVKPLLKKEECILILRDDVVNIGASNYVRATATLSSIEEGMSFSVTAYAREAETKKGMDVAQITGAASSYARKYALGGLLLLDDGNDADSQEPTQVKEWTTGKPSAPVKKPEPVNFKADIEKAIKACEGLGVVFDDSQKQKYTNADSITYKAVLNELREHYRTADKAQL